MKAKTSPRLRKHLNLHSDFAEPSQRILNAVEPNSYIRPHRHLSDPKVEHLIVLRGAFALCLFKEDGEISQVIKLSPACQQNFTLAAEIDPYSWHTLISLTSGSVLFETKSGPFNPSQAKDVATWAPEEGTDASLRYINRLSSKIDMNKWIV